MPTTVIPAQAGIQRMSNLPHGGSNFLAIAKDAAASDVLNWVPACAGMTATEEFFA
ncbi:MAG: hypothetical protein ACKOPQ_13250 [Novosphingobium sp.]